MHARIATAGPHCRSARPELPKAVGTTTTKECLPRHHNSDSAVRRHSLLSKNGHDVLWYDHGVIMLLWPPSRMITTPRTTTLNLTKLAVRDSYDGRRNLRGTRLCPEEQDMMFSIEHDQEPRCLARLQAPRSPSDIVATDILACLRSIASSIPSLGSTS